jgi:hypothetical protein
MKFVDNVRSAYRWFSVQAMVAAGALQAAWEVLPPDMKAGIPPKLVTWITVGLLVLGIAGRLVKQTPEQPK